MIFSNIKDKTFESTLPEKFKSAFQFLRNEKLELLAPGTYNLENGSRAIIQEYLTGEPQEHACESHELFYDLQYIVSGREYIGVCKRDQVEVSTPYSEEKDITFYTDTKYCNYTLLEPGDYMILAPSDVHKPCVSVDNDISVRKVVVKIPL